MAKELIKVALIAVDSSNVGKIGYNEEEKTLAIEFLNTHLFYYLDVPLEIYNGLLECNKKIPGTITSIGSYLNLFVKGKFRYIRIK